MNRRRFINKTAAATALAVSVPYIARGAGAINMRFSHYVPADHPGGVAAKQFAEKVEARTQGAVKIAVFPANQLGDPPQQLAQIREGVIDMGVPTQGQLDKYVKAFAAVELPFAFKNRPDVFRVMDGPVMDWLVPLAAEQNFVMLRNWDYGFRHVTNTIRPIVTPDDLKGLKIRTPPELQIAASMEACGAIVTPISVAELYLALSQHIVDGQENPVATIYFQKIFEVQKYLSLTHHIYNNFVHVVSAASWRKLTPAQQTILREESASAGDLMRKLIGDSENDLLAKLETAGMKVNRPDLAPFKAKMGPAIKRISEYSGAGNVEKFEAILKQMKVA